MARKDVPAITVYVTDEFKKKIEESASKQQLSASSWLKLAAVEKLGRESIK